MARHQIEEEDKEIEYLEKKLGLSGSNKKDAKDVRKRLNKELMEDGFGDDIMGFLDQMDHVLDEPDMDVIAKELSANEIAALQKQVGGGKVESKKKKASTGKMNVKALEKEVDYVTEGMSEDDGIDDMSDGLVDADYLKSFASSNGLKVVDEEGNEEGGALEDEDLLNDDDENDGEEEESDDENGEEEVVPSEEDHDSGDEDDPSDEEGNHSEEDNHSNEESEQQEETQENKEIRYEDITDIYGRVKEGKEAELQQFASKYVPPHLRNQSANATEGEGDPLEAAASKQIREVVNKVTDDTFVAMCQVSIVASLRI